MATPNIVPRVNGEGGIGTAAKGWGKLFITNKTASSATEGANITLAANDGATMANGHRLGVIEFKGAEDGAGTLTTGARIEAVTDATWSGTENGASLKFYTTDGNASQSERLSIGSDGQLMLSGDDSGAPVIHMKNVANDGTGPTLRFNNTENGGAGTAGDDLGTIKWQGRDAGAALTDYAIMLAEISDPTAGSEAGKISLQVAEFDATMTTGLLIDGDTNANGEIDVTIGAGAASDATVAGNLKVTTAVTSTNYRTIYIDAGSMVPTVTNGAAAGTEELATNDVMVDYFAFDTGTDEKVQFKMVMPEQWDGGTIKAKFYWKSSNTDTGNVAWFIQAVAHADSAVLDTAFGTAVTATADAGSGTDDDLHITAASAAMTVAGSPAEGEMVMFQIYRDVSADNYNADAHLLGVNLQYKESLTASSAW